MIKLVIFERKNTYWKMWTRNLPYETEAGSNGHNYSVRKVEPIWRTQECSFSAIVTDPYLLRSARCRAVNRRGPSIAPSKQYLCNFTMVDMKPKPLPGQKYLLVGLSLAVSGVLQQTPPACCCCTIRAMDSAWVDAVFLIFKKNINRSRIRNRRGGLVLNL